MAIRAVFFDAGGTLIHPHPTVGEVYGGVAEQLGHRAEPADIEIRWLSVWHDYQQRARRDSLPLPRSDAEDRAMWIRITRSIRDGIPAFRTLDFERWFDGIHAAFTRGACWRTYEEVPDVIAACRRQGLRCGVLSNWGSYLVGILRELGLDTAMDFVQVSALEGCLKPDREFFRRALAKAGVAAEEALHVGDTFADDAAGAQAAGLRSVHLDRSGRGLPRRDVVTVQDLRGILPLALS